MQHTGSHVTEAARHDSSSTPTLGYVCAVHYLACAVGCDESTSGVLPGICRTCHLPPGVIKGDHKLHSVVAGRSSFLLILSSRRARHSSAHDILTNPTFTCSRKAADAAVAPAWNTRAHCTASPAPQNESVERDGVPCDNTRLQSRPGHNDKGSTVVVVGTEAPLTPPEGIGVSEDALELEVHRFTCTLISSAAGGSHYVVASDAGVSPIPNTWSSAQRTAALLFMPRPLC